MLIEFSVSNFRSFRQRQTISLVAASRMKKKENKFSLDVKGEKLPDVLKACVIYGPNASGKSNLIRALQVLVILTGTTADTSRYQLSRVAVPFIFDKSLENQPSEFEVHFVAEGMRYQFNLAITKHRIVHEQLISFPNGEESNLYQRSYVGDEERYEFGPEFEADQIVREAWKSLTSASSLFIVQAVANSNEKLNQLRVPFLWLRNSMIVVRDDAQIESMSKASQDLAHESEGSAEEIARFLRDIDVPIEHIKTIKNSDDSPSELNVDSEFPIDNDLDTVLTHSSDLGPAEIKYEDESTGTKRLIGFWLPWSILSFKSASYSRHCLVFDELDSSLHPSIVSSLVERHIKAPKPSQLIFTTHDTHLMNSKLLRRDQIWVMERDRSGASILRSIHDFEGREGQDVEKRYFEGRYRGLPIIGGLNSG